MAERKVIVFGPTGAVGSSVASTAWALGAKVVLAMRDTKKQIPGLSSEQEHISTFGRVTADLTQPDTVANAVIKTGAKYAFIYLAHGSTDHMKSTIQALKAGGIVFVVFLSSFTIDKDLSAVRPDEFISYIHAQVELNLAEIFGSSNYFAARAGYFVSNNARFKKAIKSGTVGVHNPDVLVDNIVPEDIGRVCGTVLAKGLQDEKRILYLFGPALTSLRDTIQLIADTVGTKVQIEAVDDEEALRIYVEEQGLPLPVAEAMVSQAARQVAGDTHSLGLSINIDDLTNVEKYSGRRGTTLAEWAQQNKNVFV